MEFFVPNPDGSGPLPAEEAEAAWQACRKGVEGEIGDEATERRIYSVRFHRDGKPVEAIVGELDPYAEAERVMAIIEAGAVYKICCMVRGYLKVGATPMVGRSSALAVRDFD